MASEAKTRDEMLGQLGIALDQLDAMGAGMAAIHVCQAIETLKTEPLSPASRPIREAWPPELGEGPVARRGAAPL